MTIDGIPEIFDVQPDDSIEADPESDDDEIEDLSTQPDKETATAINNKLDQQLTAVVRAITTQFAEQLDQQKEYIFGLRKELQEKDNQLRLLPDLQKQAADERKTAQEKAFEIEAQKKQIAALSEQLSKLQQPWWKRFVNK